LIDFESFKFRFKTLSPADHSPCRQSFLQIQAEFRELSPGEFRCPSKGRRGDVSPLKTDAPAR
jgi:hypothetical protein